MTRPLCRHIAGQAALHHPTTAGSGGQPESASSWPRSMRKPVGPFARSRRQRFPRRSSAWRCDPPLDPNMAGWQRLSRSPIGLVPLSGQPMMIRRERLAKAIRGAEATPLAIDWVGPTNIEVIYREMDAAENAGKSRHTRSHTGRTGSISDLRRCPRNSRLFPKLPPSELSIGSNSPWNVCCHRSRRNPGRNRPSSRRAHSARPCRCYRNVTARDPPMANVDSNRRTYEDVSVEAEIDMTLTEPQSRFPDANLQRGHRLG